MQHNRQPEIAVGQVDGLRDCENRVIEQELLPWQELSIGYYDGSMVWPNGEDIQSNIGM